MRKLIMIAVVAVTACSDDPTTLQDVTPITTAGLHIRYPEVDDFARSYAVYVPESVDLSGPLVPAIMVLHGFPPVDMSAVTSMSEAAEEHGFIAVYPKSNDGNEWAMACDRCSPNAAIGVDDVHYFQVVVDALPRILPVDPDRIFLTGFSNGGMMTFRAACTLSDRIAAFAPVGAGIWTWHTENCSPSRDAPILMINGTADPSFPWEGVDVPAPLVGGDAQIPVLDAVAFYAGLNGCAAEPEVGPPVDDYDDGTVLERWSFPGCGAETLFYKIEAGGHTWPGMVVDFIPRLGTKSLELVATDSIVSFFLRQSR